MDPSRRIQYLAQQVPRQELQPTCMLLNSLLIISLSFFVWAAKINKGNEAQLHSLLNYILTI